MSEEKTPQDNASTDTELKTKIQQVIDEIINPGVAMHGGYVNLVDVKGNQVFLQFSGGCHGCAMSAMTLKSGIEATLREEVSPELQLVDVTDHASGENPYFTHS